MSLNFYAFERSLKTCSYKCFVFGITVLAKIGFKCFNTLSLIKFTGEKCCHKENNKSIRLYYDILLYKYFKSIEN